MAITNITEENLASNVLANGNTVLLDFYATWCAPCKLLAPTINEVAQENEGIIVGKVDIDQHQKLCDEFSVTSVPTLIVLRGGKEVTRHMGVLSKDEILEMMRKAEGLS